MAEYIELEALKILFAGACAECRDFCAEFDGIEEDCNQCLLNGIIKDAKSIHAADVRPVVKARWNVGADGWECSNCTIESNNTYPICPYCGAEMRPEPPKEE